MNWTPVDGFDCSRVLVEFLLRLGAVLSGPDEKFVVVPPRRKLMLVVRRPPEAAHFLSVAQELLLAVVVRS